MASIRLVGRRAPAVAATLAADLGAARVCAGLVVDGRVEMSETAAASSDRLAAFLDLGGRLIASVGCARIGVAVPTDTERGAAGQDLAMICENSLGLRARVIDRAVAIGIAETEASGVARRGRTVVMSVGAGVDVAVLEQGRPLGGGRLGGGVLGARIPVVETSDHHDSHGARSSIEAVCAAPRIVDYSGPAYRSISDVYAGVRRGDDMARHGVARYRRMLVRALVALAYAHAPDVIVVGGAPMTRGTPLLDGVEEEVGARLPAGVRVAIVRGTCGDRGALIGAAACAWGGDPAE